MFNKQIFQDLLQKDMSRKQFLQMAGVAILGLLGVSAFLKNLDKFASHHSRSDSDISVRNHYGR